jgi:hypothetical protein
MWALSTGQRDEETTTTTAQGVRLRQRIEIRNLHLDDQQHSTTALFCDFPSLQKRKSSSRDLSQDGSEYGLVSDAAA